MMPGNSPPETGLPESAIARINAIFAAVPKIEQVILYGSRAKGTFRHGSDIDLVIKGEKIDHSQLLRIERQLDDLLLPYIIDLSLLHRIDNQELLDHIKRIGVIFYQRTIP